MNKNILQFAHEAGFSVLRNGDIVSPYREDSEINELLEDFAALIIRECVDMCKSEWSGDSLDDICDQMLKHFGVE